MKLKKEIIRIDKTTVVNLGISLKIVGQNHLLLS